MASSPLILVGLGALAFFSLNRLRTPPNNGPSDTQFRGNPMAPRGRPFRTRSTKVMGLVEDWPDPTEFTDAEDRCWGKAKQHQQWKT